MSNQVFIIEAPNKCEKIAQITGGKVFATKGHFKQLAEEEWLDLQSYTPKFDFMKEKKKNIDFYIRECKDKEVFIATDPDREGYAIGYFFYELVKGIAKSVKRAEFHEITKTGIEEGLKKAIPFNQTNFAMFEAFKGRAVGDKLVGWIMSPKLSNQMGERGLSVGRVQTPALSLIVDRELAIQEFEAKPKDEKVSYKPTPFLKVGDKLKALNNESLRFATKDEAEKEFADFKEGDLAYLEKMEAKEVKKETNKPFQAVTMIQTANQVFGFSSEQTMSLAQNLYEKGLISYHRTDAENLSKEFLEEVRAFLAGEEWYSYTEYKAGKQSQAEAHEAIRITHPHPKEQIEEIIKREGLTSNHQKLYTLIWENSIYSQSKPKIKQVTSLTFSIKGVPFKISFSKLVYSSYGEGELDKENAEESVIADFKEGEKYPIEKFEIAEVKAKAPSRYKESDFIPLLQKEGIGRPSTYASFIPKLLERGYIEILKTKVSKKDKEEIKATDKGIKAIKNLKENGDEWITQSIFTREMEEVLDSIVEGEKKYLDFIKPLHQKMGETSFAQSKTIVVPSEKQIKLMEDLSVKLNLEIPQEARENIAKASEWLDKAFKLDKKQAKPSEKQIVFAEKLSQEKNLDLPKDYKDSLESCKKFIDKAMKTK